MTEFSRAFRDAVAHRYKGGSIRGRVPECLRELARNHLSEVLDAGGTVEGAARHLASLEPSQSTSSAFLYARLQPGNPTHVLSFQPLK